MIETIDSNLVHDSAWEKISLTRCSAPPVRPCAKSRKRESAGENEMESDAGEADGDTEKQIKNKG